MRLRLPFLAAALLGAALASAGCASTAPEATGTLPSSFPNHSFADIRAALARGTDTLRAFRADARLSIDTPARSGSFSANMRARRGPDGDSLQLALRKFGVEVARMLTTPDSFFVYDAVRNRLTYGALADAGTALPAPLRTGRAFANLLGLVTPSASLGWRVRPSNADEGANRYVLTAEDGRRRRRLVVDPSRWRALQYTERTTDGALVEERRFSEFGRFAGIFLPRRAELRRPREQSNASIYYRDLALNPGDLPPFALNVPDGAERTPVSQR